MLENVGEVLVCGTDIIYFIVNVFLLNNNTFF